MMLELGLLARFLKNKMVDNVFKGLTSWSLQQLSSAAPLIFSDFSLANVPSAKKIGRDSWIFTRHTGHLSPGIWSIDLIRVNELNCQIPREGLLLWYNVEWYWKYRKTRSRYLRRSWLFRSIVASKFNHIYNLDHVCQAHQLVQKSLNNMFPR